MPLSLTLIVRPSRAAAIALAAGVACLVSASLAVAGVPWLGGAASGAALVATAYAAGLLAPIHGRGARMGLGLARAGILVVAGGALLTTIVDGPWGLVVGVVGLVAAIAGLRLLVAASRAEGELPLWTYAAVLAGVGVTALLGPGGVVVLAAAWLTVAWTIRASTRRLHAPIPATA